MTSQSDQDLIKTPLYDLHVAHGAKLTGFAGYHMPVNYGPGVLKEHLHTRAAAGLFDVSHMGQIHVAGEEIAAKLETVIPVDLVGLDAGRQKYGMLLNDRGGILDDLMVMNRGDQWTLVVNAACKQDDLATLKNNLGDALSFELDQSRGLLALQGPHAAQALQSLTDFDLGRLVFMDVAQFDIGGARCVVSRSGYTGEDGFEISVANDEATALAEALLAQESVLPIGLGARDSLRMEAGLCLYGQDMNADITPVEAGLNWAISPVRRADGNRAGGFPGADIVLQQLTAGAKQTLTGLLPDGRAPMRAGTNLFDDDGKPIGTITSGGFSPTLSRPISIARVDKAQARPDNRILAEVRGKQLPATLTRMPFVPHQYVRDKQN